MKRYSLTQLADHAVLEGLKTRSAAERDATSDTLAYLAETDARKLYLAAGYSSMFAFCVGDLRYSEDEAWKRIQTARAAGRFPVIFPALAESRLHLSAVVLLAPYLRPENTHELIPAAAHKTCAGIRLMLVERFPRPDVPTHLRPIAPPAAACQPAPGQVGMTTDEQPALPALDLAGPPACEHESQPATQQVGMTNREPATQQVDMMPGEHATPHVPAPPASAARPRLTPLSPQRFALQVTLSQETHDMLLRAQALLGHTVASGDLAQVLDRALALFVAHLERQRFAATSKPRARRSSAKGRTIPAETRRGVWQRDGGRCTFVSDKGHRCESRSRLEYDHMQPVARGGRSTMDSLRLRCRAHNQHAAEIVFGAGFMREKREAARRSAPTASSPG